VNAGSRSRVTRAGWAVWRAVLTLNTIALLSVAVYAAIQSSEDGPSATPLLMAGLLSLGVMILGVTSAVNALLWGAATHASWLRRLGAVFFGFAGAVIVLTLAIYASDYNDVSMRWVGLVLFPCSVIRIHVLNRRAVALYRTQTLKSG
jgi:hypothetical protein